MAGPNVPCKNPKVCGVKSHRNGTVARCMTTPNRRTPGMKDAAPALTAVPGITSGYKESPLNLDGRGILRDMHDGHPNIEVELPEGDAGERRFLLLNTNAEPSDMSRYWGHYMNRLESAKIITADGVVVYAGSHRGGSLTRNVLKDGAVRNGPVIPIDADGDWIDSKLTSAEYDSLCDLDKTAEALGYTESDDPLLEIIGNAVDQAKEGWEYQPKG